MAGVEVVLRWRGEGSKVSVAGQWNEWKEQELSKEGDSWVLR